jgi:hypothetical protein
MHTHAGLWFGKGLASRGVCACFSRQTRSVAHCPRVSPVTRDAAVASLAQVITPGSLDMVASGTRHNGAAWRRHGRGLVARRAAMGRRAILRGFFCCNMYHYVRQICVMLMYSKI